MNEAIKKLSLALEELRIKIEDKIDADGGLLIINEEVCHGMHGYGFGNIYAIARTTSGNPHICATEMEVY